MAGSGRAGKLWKWWRLTRFSYAAAIAKVVRLRESMRGYVFELFERYAAAGEPVRGRADNSFVRRRAHSCRPRHPLLS